MKKTSTVKISKPITFNAKSYERNGITEDEVNQIKEAFDLFDIEGLGSIDIKQLKTAFNTQGFDTKNETLYRAVLNVEADGNKSISFDEFFSIMTARLSDKPTKETMKRVFSFFDDENTGFISTKNLKRIVKEVGENLDEQELYTMVEKADKDNDGLVSEEEFYQIMVKKAK